MSILSVGVIGGVIGGAVILAYKAFLTWVEARYRVSDLEALETRLRALESTRIDISRDDWENLKQDVAGLRVANGFRTRKHG